MAARRSARRLVHRRTHTKRERRACRSRAGWLHDVHDMEGAVRMSAPARSRPTYHQEFPARRLVRQPAKAFQRAECPPEQTRAVRLVRTVAADASGEQLRCPYRVGRCRHVKSGMPSSPSPSLGPRRARRSGHRGDRVQRDVDEGSGRRARADGGVWTSNLRLPHRVLYLL